VIIDKSIIVKDKPINQPTIRHMSYSHKFANLWWTYLRLDSFPDVFFLRTFQRLVLWGLHPNLIFSFLGIFSKPDFLGLGKFFHT